MIPSNKKSILILAFIFTTYLSSITANYADEALNLPGSFFYTYEGSTQYDRLSSSFDSLLPLFYLSEQGTYLFFAPKQTFHSKHGAKEFNYGLGIRQLCWESFILGFNVYYDKRQSPTHRYHYQRGYGFEILSDYLDMRFNFYDPISKPRRIGKSQGYKLGSSGLIRWEKSLFEEALEGFDWEIGVPVPFKQLNTKIFAGSSHYNPKLSKNFSFFNIRTETKVTDWLTLDFALKIPDNHHTLNDDDKIYFNYGFRVEIPLDFGSLFDLKHPVRRKETNHLKKRLFERVVRDLDIQVQGKENYQEQVEQPLIYVNNTNTTGTENGTLEHPFSSLTSALASPLYTSIKSIYLFRGDGTAYTGNYTLSAGTKLWGSAYSGNYGIPVSGYPIIEGTGTNNTLNINSNSDIAGCQITGSGSNNAIYGSNLQNVTIHNNLITGNKNGIYIDSAAGNIVVAGNTIINNSDKGIYGYNITDTAFMDNIIQNNKRGIELNYVQNNTVISGNIIANNTDDGVYAFMVNNININNNSISNNNYGIRIYEYDSIDNIIITGNSMSSNTTSDTFTHDSTGFSFEEFIFYEYYNNYTQGVDPNTVSDWIVFGLEHSDRYVVGDAQNNWLDIIFDSPAGGVPPAWVSFGLTQSANWNPNKDFTSATIKFDIKSDLGSAIPSVIAVQVSAICNETGEMKTFRTPDANLMTIPSSTDGWVSISVNASDLTYNEAAWATANLSKVEKVEILFLQTSNNFVANGNVYIDNFKANE